jgi:hypothetical protein
MLLGVLGFGASTRLASADAWDDPVYADPAWRWPHHRDASEGW